MATRRRRRSRRRSLRPGTYRVGRKRRVRRLRVHRIKGRAHHLRRGFYRANPRRRRRRYKRNPRLFSRKGIFSNIPSVQDLLFASAGAIGAPYILAKTGLKDKLPGTGALGVIVQAAAGAIIAGFAGKMIMRKPHIAEKMAFGAAFVPVVGWLVEQEAVKKFLGAGSYDFGDATAVEGGLYTMPLSGGLYTSIGGPDETPDFGNM